MCSFYRKLSNVCMHICMRAFVTFCSYSLSNHGCTNIPNRKDFFCLLQNNDSVSVESRNDEGREIHSFGAHAAKLRGRKLEVRQASTCKSPRPAERLPPCTSCNWNMSTWGSALVSTYCYCDVRCRAFWQYATWLSHIFLVLSLLCVHVFVTGRIVGKWEVGQ